MGEPFQGYDFSLEAQEGEKGLECFGVKGKPEKRMWTGAHFYFFSGTHHRLFIILQVTLPDLGATKGNRKENEPDYPASFHRVSLSCHSPCQPTAPQMQCLYQRRL